LTTPLFETMAAQPDQIEEEQKESGISIGIKHPLQRKWTMWFDSAMKQQDRASTQANWSSMLREVLTVGTVEDFWGLYNNIEAASNLAVGCNYHFFHSGIRPEWEDAANKRGGSWLFTCKRRADLDKKWLWTLLACVGESFPAAEQICGVVVSLKNHGNDRISVWTNNESDDENVKKLDFISNLLSWKLKSKFNIENMTLGPFNTKFKATI